VSVDVVKPELTDITAYDHDEAASALAHLLATGDVSAFTPAQRVAYYLAYCERLGLESLSRPFDWLTLDGRLVFYPNAGCANQLKRQHQISVYITRKAMTGDLFCVEVEGRTPSGRVEQASKYVPVTGYSRERGVYRLTGQKLGDAFAKAETGAKRRLIMAMVGLGAAPDLEEVKQVERVYLDAYGNIIEHPTDEQKRLAEQPKEARAIGEPTFETTVDPAQMPDLGGSLAPSPEELTPQRRPAGPASDVKLRPVFGSSAEDQKRWKGAWFSIVKEHPRLSTDDGRHEFVAAYTAAEWPANKQTNSLETFFKRCTADDAAQFLAHVRTVVEADRASAQPQDDGEDQETTPEARGAALPSHPSGTTAF
jgi:hypothetical protein